MNFLKKGPELNLSSIKVPDFVLDLYYDLKERHLLPVAAVLLAAIVVVPFALTQSGGTEEAVESGAATSAAAADGSNQLVARSAPPLRKYQRRLAHLAAKDPFVQQYVEREAGHGETSSASNSEASADVGGPTAESPTAEVVSPESFSPSSSSPSSEPAPSNESSSPNSGSGSGKEQEAEAPSNGGKWFSYAVDVRIVTRGDDPESATESDAAAEPEASTKPKSTVRHNLPELTMLPSRKAPALTYMGSTKDGKKALMLVSSDVKSIFGDARCVIGSQTCQLLALEPELPETVIYGDSGRTYTIELRKIHLVESSEIDKATLGEPAAKKPRKKSAW